MHGLSGLFPHIGGWIDGHLVDRAVDPGGAVMNEKIAKVPVCGRVFEDVGGSPVEDETG
jgi:hypothetical protein